jgi:hypothetical protein
MRPNWSATSRSQGFGLQIRLQSSHTIEPTKGKDWRTNRTGKSSGLGSLHAEPMLYAIMVHEIGSR